MDFTALKAAVASRGFARLSAADQGQAVNDAVHELDQLEPRWPYLFTSSSGTAPLVVTDLGDVTTVLNTYLDVPVQFSDYEDLAGWAGELTRTGADPDVWYFTPGSSTSVSTFPVTTRTIQVFYYKASPDLSAGSDTPLAPARWHHLIVDMAVRNAHVARGVDPPGSLLETIGRKLAGMQTDLFYRQSQGPSQVLPSGWNNF